MKLSPRHAEVAGDNFTINGDNRAAQARYARTGRRLAKQTLYGLSTYSP
ncbi:hypothetical protein GA0070620_5710 [Micromonospora krabiensis]|uniref:Uncharacterized protein n=1 Tax=Micromonospora krabiensis TaxID=307121 RepID=A0A1C3NBY8_9ACTN|nr:hypothetical protein GA0070620_5710 [Micromonospora krabiensis]